MCVFVNVCVHTAEANIEVPVYAVSFLSTTTRMGGGGLLCSICKLSEDTPSSHNVKPVTDQVNFIYVLGFNEEAQK